MILLGEAHWLKPPTLVRPFRSGPFAWVVLWQEILVRNTDLKSHTNWKSLGKVERRHHVQVHFPESLTLASILAEWCVHHQERLWIRMIGQRQPGNNSHHHKARDWEPRGRAILLGSFTLLLSTWVPFPNKISCFVSRCVSLDNSFLSVRQEPSLGPLRCNRWT